MEFNCPERISNMKIISSIYTANDKQEIMIDSSLETLENDLLMDTMEENKVKRWEKILSINPADTDTLTERRYRIKGRINDGVPYTLLSIQKKLDTLVGKGNYKLVLSDDLMRLECKIDLVSKAMYNDTVALLEDLVPLNMEISTSLLYNNHQVLSQYTHEHLAQYTHKQLREGILS